MAPNTTNPNESISEQFQKLDLKALAREKGAYQVYPKIHVRSHLRCQYNLYLINHYRIVSSSWSFWAWWSRKTCWSQEGFFVWQRYKDLWYDTCSWYNHRRSPIVPVDWSAKERFGFACCRKRRCILPQPRYRSLSGSWIWQILWPSVRCIKHIPFKHTNHEIAIFTIPQDTLRICLK